VSGGAGAAGIGISGKHPPIAAGKIALDLNYDNVMPLGAPEEVEVSGAERTTFYPAVEATAKEFRLAIRPDALPRRDIIIARITSAWRAWAYRRFRLMRV